MFWMHEWWLEPKSCVKQPFCTLDEAQGCQSSKTLCCGNTEGSDLAHIGRLDQFICSLAGLNRITWMWLIWLFFFPLTLFSLSCHSALELLLTELFRTLRHARFYRIISPATRGCFGQHDITFSLPIRKWADSIVVSVVAHSVDSFIDLVSPPHNLSHT